MKYIFLFFILNLICFGIIAVLSDKLPLFEPQQLEYLDKTYGINTNEEFAQFFREMKEQGLILEIINRQNAEIVGIIAFLNLVTLFVTLHLLADKLFFKTIAEPPNVRSALRRGLMLSLIIASIILLRLYNLAEWYILLFLIILFVFIEFVVSRLNIRKDATKDDLQETSESKQAI